MNVINVANKAFLLKCLNAEGEDATLCGGNMTIL